MGKRLPTATPAANRHPAGRSFLLEFFPSLFFFSRLTFSSSQTSHPHARLELVTTTPRIGHSYWDISHTLANCEASFSSIDISCRLSAESESRDHTLSATFIPSLCRRKSGLPSAPLFVVSPTFSISTSSEIVLIISFTKARDGHSCNTRCTLDYF